MKPAQTRITPAKAVLFTTILMLATLASLEGAIRIWAYYFRSTYEVYDVTKGRYMPVPGVHSHQWRTTAYYQLQGVYAGLNSRQKSQRMCIESSRSVTPARLATWMWSIPACCTLD